MNFLDFIYDNMCLSDFGCIICTFDDNNGFETKAGANIVFNTVSVNNGKRHLLTSANYESRLEAEFQICKNPDYIDEYDDRYFTEKEYSDLSRWLCRMDFNKMQLINESGEYHNMFFNGSFNIDVIRHLGRIAGFTLKFISDKPFASNNEKIYRFSISNADEEYSIVDTSDEIGFQFIHAEIKCKSNGTLRIRNKHDNKTTEIRNCVNGETITITYMNITTSNSSHSSTIMDDFNYVFPAIMNNFRDRKNTYIFSMPCEVVFKYNPTRKVSL